MRVGIAMYIVKHLPKRVKYWAGIAILTHATTGKYGKTIVPEITALEALKRYGEDNDLWLKT